MEPHDPRTVMRPGLAGELAPVTRFASIRPATRTTMGELRPACCARKILLNLQMRESLLNATKHVNLSDVMANTWIHRDATQPER